jgi:hypothetical protein
MKITRKTHSLRFSNAGWKLITIRAKERLGLDNRRRIQRARYLEELTLNESANSEKEKK